MGAPRVLVVGETPSLGRSISDLLESENVPNRYVYDLAAEEPLASLASRYAVIVAAASGYFCTTARRWLRGEMPGVQLVVVGSRDPLIPARPEVRQVGLPLEAARLLSSIRDLLGRVAAGSSANRRSG